MAEVDDPKPEGEDAPVATDQGAKVERIAPPAAYDPEKEGLPASSLDEALGALVSDPRRYGAAVLFRFAWGWARDVMARQADLTKKNDEFQRENRELHKDLAQVREENAALKATAVEKKRHRPLILLANGLGPVLFFMGIDAFSNNRLGTGWTLVIAGLALVGVAVWLAK